MAYQMTSGPNNMAATCDKVRESQVEAAVKAVEYEIDKMREQVVELESRLNDVLLPPSPTPTKGGETPMPMSSPLAAVVYRLAKKIAETADGVADIRSRVDV